MKTSVAWTIAILFCIAVGWFYFAMPKPAPAPAVPQITASTTPTGVAYVAGNLLLGTDGNASIGKYLIGSNGMTLYTYANDTGGTSNCTGQCAVAWPPYTITDTSVLSNIQSGIGGHVGYIARPDGMMQVTYNDMPLYFFKGDVQSGDTNGQGVGGVWYVAAP